jgi:1-acyl-sn-glycerol-3-phosphate acyltransferase
LNEGRNLGLWERVRSLLFFDPLIYLYTTVLGSLSLLSSFFDRDGRIQHGFARLWSRMILKTSLCRLRVSGLDQLGTSKPYIYAVNHLSALDIPCLYAGLPVQFRIMAKRNLFNYPFLGWHLRRSGQIAIDRSDARSSLRSLMRASETVHNGMSMLVFPEGGRSQDGLLQEFLGGAFYVAIKAGVEVVPMALVGTRDALPMNSYVIRPTQFELVVGKPISTEGMTVREMDKLAEITKQAIADLYYPRANVQDPRLENAGAEHGQPQQSPGQMQTEGH